MSDQLKEQICKVNNVVKGRRNYPSHKLQSSLNWHPSANEVLRAQGHSSAPVENLQFYSLEIASLPCSLKTCINPLDSKSLDNIFIADMCGVLDQSKF